MGHHLAWYSCEFRTTFNLLKERNHVFGVPLQSNTQYTIHCQFMLFKKNDIIQFLYFQFAKSISKTQAHQVLSVTGTILWLYVHYILQGNYFSLQDQDFYEACAVHLGIVHGSWALRGVSSCEHCRLLRGSTVEEQVGSWREREYLVRLLWLVGKPLNL